MVGHISIRKKLMISPIVIIIMLIAMSANFVKISNSNIDSINEIKIIAVEKISRVDQFVSQGYKLRSGLFQSSVLGMMKDSDNLKITIENTSQTLNEFRKTYEYLLDLELSDEERDLFIKLEKPIGAFFGGTENAMKLMAVNPAFGGAMVRASGDQLEKILFMIDEIRTYQLEKFDDKTSAVVQSSQLSLKIQILLSALMVIIAVAVSWFTGAAISGPIKKLSRIMSEFAANNYDIDVFGVGRRDEIGVMAKTLEVFKNNSLEVQKLEKEAKEQQKIREKRSQKIVEITRSFNDEVAQLLRGLLVSSDKIKDVIEHIQNSAQESNDQAQTASEASIQSSKNVQFVASATEQLVASINEINQQVTRFSSISSDVSSETQQTQKVVVNLADAIQDIESVISLINEIANQTNMLALNATIEAFRAGDAGQGFAVVASEVKGLASQTGDATQKIDNQIKDIQGNSRLTVDSIENISVVVKKMQETLSSILSAITQQHASTNEIAKNVEDASIKNKQVADNVQKLSGRITENLAVTNDAKSAADELAESTEKMRDVIRNFIRDVKDA